jgi:hypothetical protein
MMKTLTPVIMLLASLGLGLTAHAQENANQAIDLPAPAEANPEVVRFERHRFSVQRVRGKVLVDNVVAPNNIVESRATEVRLIEHFDNESFASSRQFRSWVKNLRGARTYTYDIAFLRQPDGSVLGTPLVLLPNQIRHRVDHDWEKWLAKERMTAQERQASKEESQRQETLVSLVQSQASALQQLQQRQVNHRQDRWRVYLSPIRLGSHGTLTSGVRFSTGSFYQPAFAAAYSPSVRKFFDVAAGNSLLANQIAQDRFPGYRITSTLKLRSR